MSVEGAHATPGPPPAATVGATYGPTGDTAAPAALRAQLLATEHWSLLATRSMTWSEIMSRITIQLTVLSASLVVLALVAQASGFGGPFRVLSIGLASAILLLGTLTAVRVVRGSMEDHALVIGMNRLRAAYLTLRPLARGVPGHARRTTTWPEFCARTRWGPVGARLHTSSAAPACS